MNTNSSLMMSTFTQIGKNTTIPLFDEYLKNIDFFEAWNVTNNYLII